MKITANDNNFKQIENIRVFEYEEEEEDFRELEIDEGVPLHSLLGSEYILLFINPVHKRVYHWIGNDTRIKMKYGAASRVGKVRDLEAGGYLIRTEDEGDESFSFKIMLGLAEQMEPEVQEETKPIYNGSQDEELTNKEIIRILEKMPVPEGYEREFIIKNDEIFRYKEFTTPSYKVDISNKKLFPLKEEIDDGIYTFEDHLPRILLSYNKIKIIELLKKKEEK